MPRSLNPAPKSTLKERHSVVCGHLADGGRAFRLKASCVDRAKENAAVRARRRGEGAVPNTDPEVQKRKMKASFARLCDVSSKWHAKQSDLFKSELRDLGRRIGTAQVQGFVDSWHSGGVEWPDIDAAVTAITRRPPKAANGVSARDAFREAIAVVDERRSRRGQGPVPRTGGFFAMVMHRTMAAHLTISASGRAFGDSIREPLR